MRCLLVSKRTNFPVVNVRLEDSKFILIALLKRPEEVRNIVRLSRDWMATILVARGYGVGIC